MFVQRKERARKEARRLRASHGWSLARIARELGVAKSSVSVWVRDLRASPHSRSDAVLVRRLPVWRSGQLRRCGRCGYDLPIECFNRLRDGRQWWCRSCFTAYFRARGDLHRNQSKAAKRVRQQRLQAYVLEYLGRHPCADCGAADPVVLEFDHVGEKTAHVAALVSDAATKQAVDVEIARCDVVCVNCHRRRTAKRAGWRRAVLLEQPVRPYVSETLERNFAHVHSILLENGCVDCGERDPVVLEFDHVGRKRATVTRLAWNGCSLATIDREIRECEIRCANCHRRATASRGGHYRLRMTTAAASTS
jgi:hypothetical protein